MVVLFAGGRGVQVFVCSVQTSMGNFTGVFGLVMGGVMRDCLRFCFGGRTGVRGLVGVGGERVFVERVFGWGYGEAYDSRYGYFLVCFSRSFLGGVSLSTTVRC
jgi:hypothetical protein